MTVQATACYLSLKWCPPLWWHPLLPHFPAIVIHCCRSCWCRWHRRHAWLLSDFVPLMCYIVTVMWAGACLVTVAGNVVSQRRFVVAGIVGVCHKVVSGWTKVAVGGDAAEVDDCGCWEEEHLFVHNGHVSFQEMPLTPLSKREGCCLCKILM